MARTKQTARITTGEKRPRIAGDNEDKEMEKKRQRKKRKKRFSVMRLRSRTSLITRAQERRAKLFRGEHRQSYTRVVKKKKPKKMREEKKEKERKRKK